MEPSHSALSISGPVLSELTFTWAHNAFPAKAACCQISTMSSIRIPALWLPQYGTTRGLVCFPLERPSSSKLTQVCTLSTAEPAKSRLTSCFSREAALCHISHQTGDSSGTEVSFTVSLAQPYLRKPEVNYRSSFGLRTLSKSYPSLNSGLCCQTPEYCRRQ
ncbi:Hypothetical predicted protein [Podarcis lilfordi]|uniref:Uncharacterized protein n=1 Tax=Podarcis lilfordi TaxID=74358 RepID=A0AA35K4R2_9SAUR|nr:Hypothetical predicted protein [Podarcis lilfordi]